MLKHYIKTAWRNIIKNKTTTVINLSGLSLALTAFLFISLWVNNELSFDQYHKAAKDIYLAETKYQPSDAPGSITVLPYAETLKKDPRVLSAARLAYDKPVLAVGQNIYDVKAGAVVDSAWFDIFDYQIKSGSLAAFKRDGSSLLLTASKARQLFGDKNPIGQVVKIDSALYKVQVVVADNPINSSFQYEVLRPMSVRLNVPGRMEADNNWGNASYRTFIKVRPGTDMKELKARTTSMVRRASGMNEVATVFQPLKQLHFDNESFDDMFRRGNYSMVFIFGILSVLLLMTASVNYINLTVAKASTRSKEIGIRKIIGGSGRQLFFQFLTESFIMCILALCIALIMMTLLLPLFNRLAETQFRLHPAAPLLWEIAFGTLLLATLLNGVFPAITMAYFNPLNFLRGYTILKFKNTWFRKGLVVFQFVIGIVFIVGVIVIYQQMGLAQQASAQYQRAQVVSVSIQGEAYRHSTQRLQRFRQVLKSSLLENNAIESVAFGSNDIEGVGMNSSIATNYYFPGIDTSLKFPVVRLGLTAEAMDIFNFRIKEGRWFTKDNSDKSNFVLNETAVKTLGIGEPAVGKFFAKREGDTGRIVGVMSDYAFQSLYDKIGPMAIVNSDDDQRYIAFVKIASGKIPEGMHAIETTWKKLLPEFPLEYQFMNQAFDNIYKGDLKTSSLVLVFGIITVFISLMGLFGLAAFICESRIKEIGVRKVFGAGVSSIVMLLSADFMRLVFIAFALSVPIGWWASSSWLSNFAYKIHLNWLIFVAAGVAVMLLAFLTVSLQTLRMAKSNPLKSLRTD